MTHPYKGTPMEHQVTGLRRAWKKTSFALFWEMGTGKTYTALNLAAARFIKDQIDALIVICPTPIKLVWESEIKEWCPVDVDVRVITADKLSRERVIYLTTEVTTSLKIVVVGVEALSQGNAFTLVRNFAKMNKCMIVADESSRLKNSKATRTKRAIEIAEKCYYRVLMTGTPITQGVEDLFGQFNFLDPKIVGCKSFFQFKNRYCIQQMFDGHEKIVGYQNMEQLMKRVSPYIDIVKKEDVLDLPPKSYERMIVEPSKQQLVQIKSLKDTFEAEQGGEFLTTGTILERLTRFQQIIGGNFPFNDTANGGYGVMPIEGPNPKLNALSEILEDLPWTTKVIIWARFVPEIELIKSLISKTHPGKVVTFYGADSDDQRKDAVSRFQTGDARFIISNPQVGGMGQTWTAATLVIYYSNSFSYEDRKQSEDRAHRKGQEHAVTYIDLEVNHRYDTMILGAIRRKGDVATFVDEKIASIQEHE